MTYQDLSKMRQFVKEDAAPCKVDLVQGILDRMDPSDLWFAFINSDPGFYVGPAGNVQEEMEEAEDPIAFCKKIHDGYVEDDADVMVYADDAIFLLTWETFCETFVDTRELAWKCVAQNNDLLEGSIREVLDSENKPYPEY